jgi:hypothetical protein
MNLLDFQELKLYGHLQRLGTIPPLVINKQISYGWVKLIAQLKSSTSTSTKVPLVNDFILIDKPFHIT